ncbi:glyoxalase [Pilimelia terevasa]|uniref:Glyoxalase n=1 Tax=Pilimelia terevasa TaxID=53372 RepID=A0A8J3FG66_9ACTN|nr:VOC family protein [Pilimelia terevasa]GGK15606.1 glyoxalase [Pilimelia terevasa]
MALSARMVTIDCRDPRSLAAFWTAATGYAVAGDHDGFVLLAPAAGDGVRIGLQQVPEPRAGKNRVHIDFHADDRAAELARLAALGATVHGAHSVPGLSWTVVTDPEGNEFCVAQGD